MSRAHRAKHEMRRRAARAKGVLPEPAKRFLRWALELIDPLLVAAYRRTHEESRAIPPRRLRARVGSPSPERYFAAGEGSAEGLLAGLRAVRVDLAQAGPILDFGCGCGRTLQNLPFDPGHPAHGCDVDAEAVAWAAANLPSVEFTVNQHTPPLPYADDSFGLVYAISVFTHLDEGQQFTWLEELRRVIRPGGLALLSVMGEHAAGFNWRNMGLSAAFVRTLRAELESAEDGFAFVSYAQRGTEHWRNPGADEGYGLAFHSRDYVEKRWASVAPVAAILPGAVDGFHDLVVLRLPPT